MIRRQINDLDIWVCLKIVYPNGPMVLLIIIPTKWLFHWGYTPFSDIPISHVEFHSSAAPGSHCIFTIFIEAVVVLDTLWDPATYGCGSKWKTDVGPQM